MYGNAHINFVRTHFALVQNERVSDLELASLPEVRIGDTLSEDASIEYEPMPQFAPECFAWLEHTTPAQYKRFREGLDQLLQEGAVQSFSQPGSARRVPLLGAVGPLQFEVLQYRIQTEYGAESRLVPAPWKVIRWIDPAGDPVVPEDLDRTSVV